MDACQWEKLRKNLRLLQRDVDLDEVYPFLFERNVLDVDDKRILDAKPSNRAKISSLLEKLKELPARKNAFQSFLEALRSSKFEYYVTIADKIEKTVTTSDSSVRSKVDPSHCEADVRAILNKNFANLDGKSTDIDEIREVLKDDKAFAAGGDWSNAQIKECVMKHFVGLETFKTTISVSPKKTKLCFRHLGRIDPTPTPQGACCAESLNTVAEKDVIVDIQSMSPAELKTFLWKEFEKENLSTVPLEEIEDENINGKFFLRLSENDLKQVMPSAKYGHRMLIMSVLDRYRQGKESVQRFETFCHFDKKVESTDGYGEGKIMDLTVQTRAKKTVPIRNFHLPEFKSKDDTRNHILEECAIFTAACINERRNGTIYFGISPSDFEGRKKGQVVGLNLSVAGLDNCLLDMFFQNQRGIIKNTLRNVRCVPVISECRDALLHVMEFDVVPGAFLSEDDCIKINAKNMPNLAKKWKVRDPTFVFSECGSPVVRTVNETCSNSKVSASTIAQRRDDERKALGQAVPNLTPLRNHLTGGSDKMDDDLYTFLLLGPIASSSTNFDNLSFIKHLRPEVVFDFDPHGDPDGIFNALEEEQEEVMKVVTLNDFDEGQKSKEDIETFQSELVESRYMNWMFCNGYGQMTEMDAGQWSKKRSYAFHNAFRHYVKNCCKDRILVMICLFSPQYDVLRGACHFILQELPEQWVLLSETAGVAKYWQQTMTMMKVIEKSDLKGRCIIGLSWEQVNNGVTSWCRKEDTFECEIPDSCGVFVRVENKRINEWSDVEVLSALDPINPDDDEDTLRTKKKQAEKNFYCGGQVEWLNFFSDHVCRRKVHEELYGLVMAALEGRNQEEEDRVLITYLCHEPGAGGSTSARQILWSLRQKYRCCLVREITNQTIDQLTEIYFFKERSPKPILVLLDNEDEDKLFQLRISLERKARDKCISDIFCVLLICYRTVSVPVAKRKQSIVTLKQFLDKQDLIWFKDRYDYLKTQYVNPKSLISFNILKENFNKEYIQNTVKEFVDEIKDKNEETVLKFVSLINNFDIDFKFINVSCFDFILEGRQMLRSGTNWNRKTSWEANVSESLKVLLNLSSNHNQAKKQRKTIRVFNKLTAEHIQNCIRAKTEESVSDIVTSLLTRKIFDETGQDMKHLKMIISNMVKKRAFNFKEVWIRKEKFSPLILYIKENEGTDKAGEIMELLFDLNRDPFTAQQIARFYISNRNYKKAEQYAESATSMLPKNSYMWDTYAQVFKAQLTEKVQSAGQSVEDKLSNEEIKELTALCQKCTDLFRKEQSVSEKEELMGSEGINLAGYFGELRSIIQILTAIQKCRSFDSKKMIHDFLIDENYLNTKLEFLSQDEKDYLKNLWKFSKETIRKLDDGFLQTKVEIEANPFCNDDDSKRTLLMLRVTLNEYFGESSDEVPSYLNEEERCKWRWRIVFSKKASSLYNTLQLKHNSDFEVLIKCYRLMLENVRSPHSKVEDISTLLDIVTVLLIEGREPPGLKFEHLIQWSQKLCWESLKKNGGSCSLQTFMYFFLFNFPTDERLTFRSLACAQDLTTVLKHWKEHFNLKRNVQRLTHRETTLFFLGNGHPFFDIVYQKKLQDVMDGSEYHEKWHQPEIPGILKVMSGYLSEAGNYVSYCYKNKEGNQNWIDIKTADRTKTAWHQKKIYFYLGFSFSGLKAYGMTDKDPMTPKFFEYNSKATRTRAASSHRLKLKQNIMPLGELQHKKQIITNKIAQKKRENQGHADLDRDLDEINRNISEIIGD